MFEGDAWNRFQLSDTDFNKTVGTMIIRQAIAADVTGARTVP